MSDRLRKIMVEDSLYIINAIEDFFMNYAEIIEKEEVIRLILEEKREAMLRCIKR